MTYAVSVSGRKYEIGKAYFSGCVIEVFTDKTVVYLDTEVSKEDLDEYAELTDGIRIYTGDPRFRK